MGLGLIRIVQILVYSFFFSVLTPLKNVPAPEPVYMADGFQYLNSDEDEEPPERPIPAWSTSKVSEVIYF